jgi:DNA mismatch repair protein MutS
LAVKKAPKKDASETPLMKQYNAVKAKHPQALLLFRVGDFYETFASDAVETARILGIVLTSRRNGSSDVELAGFPHHSLETYLPKLVRAGKRVAICDQLEDPKLTKNIVKRGVTELVTPGVSFNDNVLEQKKNNFLCAIHFNKDNSGIAFLDISTGEFFIAEGTTHYLDKLIQGFQPSEIIFQKKAQKEFDGLGRGNVHTFRLEDWVFTEDFALENLNKHFQTKSLKGFGVEELTNGIIAGGAILHYLSETHHDKLSHITQVGRIEEERYVWLDRFTIRNLELVYSQHENATTLIDILDQTLTPMGGRMMKRWMVLPLKDLKPINDRLNAVKEFKENQDASQKILDKLKIVGDLERLISKTAVGKINPKEAMQLLRTLKQIDPIKTDLKFAQSDLLKHIAVKLNACQELMNRVETTLHEDPAVQISKGKVIADGFHKELDELRAIAYSGKDYLDAMQIRESEATGITSLKINFNNVFGYFIEVRNTHKDKVPEHWIRKQTLVSAERYITEELKEYETKILGAEDKIHALESKIYQELILWMSDFTMDIQMNSNLLGQLDCLLSFATVAMRNNYAYPEMNEGLAIKIHNGRHPVIEKQLKQGEQYIANDVFLDDKDQQIIMITGPNMSGKSAILRQTALICLMAQMGCFVPAEKAELGVLDKIFTRVGASDNISSGESTFMVEMNETSSILNNLSDRSLILLDEIGRGTSTYDGISIAWAIAEYLHEHPKAKAKTLFATHYHELNEMCNQFERIKNYNVQVKEIGQKILFLRKLVEGGSEHSFGIHVAKLAGMPNTVVQRATKILEKLEESQKMSGNGKKVMTKDDLKEVMNSKDMQLSFFQLNDPVLEQIREELVSIDINVLTPVEALMKLNDIKKYIGG